MPKPRTPKTAPHPAFVQDLPNRLAELEAELHRHAGRKPADRALTSISGVTAVTKGLEKSIQFSVNQKSYTAGHEDLTYGGTNHARGIRHIRFYEAQKMVLEIEGSFEDQQMGSNFI